MFKTPHYTKKNLLPFWNMFKLIRNFIYLPAKAKSAEGVNKFKFKVLILIILFWLFKVSIQIYSFCPIHTIMN